jgi:dipeptidyl aminopeptidase/acylaminoacyl peptidase
MAKIHKLLTTTSSIGRRLNQTPYLQAPALYRDVSSFFAVSNQTTAPTCIVQGTADTLVPLPQSIALRNKLSSLGGLLN